MNKENKKQNKLQTRPPVVVVLGHIDHGKSTLLQAVKDFGILEKEAGGITQHIGAYEVEEDTSTRSAGSVQAGSAQAEKITFIDTPGHEAFSAMRSRGAKVADIAVLVVAGDEGVKPQTKEAISYIKKAQIPMIVAINKMDKSNADPDRVRRELAEQKVELEARGGKVPGVEVSAKTGKNIDQLLEVILLVAEMEQLETDLSAEPKGVIIESYLDEKRGPTATLILREGILTKGDIIATSSTSGKIKSLEDFQGKAIEKVVPSQPTIVLGFSEVPPIGGKVRKFDSQEQAKQFVRRQQKEEESRTVLDVESGEKVLNLMIKVDVLGSIEAIEQSLSSISQEKVKLRILKSEVGQISESDVRFAQSGQAAILGFRVETSPRAESFAEQTGVEVKTFDVIYELIEAVQKLMEQQLAPETVKQQLGIVKALIIFKTGKRRQIVGGKITKGEVTTGALIEVIRDQEKVGKGKLVNLQKNKKDVERLTRGEECGILFEGNVKIKKGDLLRIYKEKKKQRKL